MTRICRLLLAGLFTIALFAHADTVILHDGTSYSGQLGNSGTINFTDSQGIQYQFPRHDVQSLVFTTGNDIVTLRNGTVHAGHFATSGPMQFEDWQGVKYEFPQQDIESIMGQQRMGATGAINPDTAAKMGQILGLNAIVTGSITAYSEAEEGSDFIIGKSKKQIARVTVDYRVVDTTTGVQLLADSGAGIYEKKSTTMLGGGGTASYDTDLRDGALRDALTKAMVNMMQQLESQPWKGKIAKVSGNQLYINAGKKTGLKVGDKLDVYRVGEDIIDPDTHQKLGTTEDRVGQAIIQRNDLGDKADMSLAITSSGTGFKQGDIVKFVGN